MITSTGEASTVNALRDSINTKGQMCESLTSFSAVLSL